MKPLLLLLTILSLNGYNFSRAAVLLQDDFGGSSIDSSLWTITRPYQNSNVAIYQGQAVITARGTLNSIATFPADIEIRGRFTFTGSLDQLAIVFRSDLTTWGNYSEISGAGVFFEQDNQRVSIQRLGFNDRPQSYLSNFNFQANTPYDFRIIDSNNLISVFINGSVMPIVVANFTNRTGNHIAIHNREFTQSQSKVDYVTVESSMPQPPPDPVNLKSPVGSWEIAVTRTKGIKETGTAFVTFYSDKKLNGYALTTRTLEVVTLTGVWSQDATGKITAQYAEDLDGETINGTITGIAKSGKSLKASAIASNGSFNLVGKPTTTIPIFSGSWLGFISELGSTVLENFQITPLEDFPGVFEISGDGDGPSGPFTVSGEAIANSKGDLTAYAFSDFDSGDWTVVSLSGKLNLAKQTATLTGMDIGGNRVKAKLFRP